ncbi:MAG: hypothetical protein IJP70_10450 [Bacteroidales bacterium]|nr:hypothetical protein [Bacteroidales bacterium]
MAQFQPLNYKIKLKNAQHFAFMQAFTTALTNAGFSAQKIAAKKTQLETAFQEEDRYYMITRASEIVAQREAADLVRDRFYTRLHRLVQVWAGSGMAQLDEAATALLRPFDLYKVRVNAQVDEETGQLENLITDISTTAMQAHIATINGTYLFQQMKQAHDQVKSLRLDQGVEKSEKVLGALAAARKACDALYDELTALIEAFAVTADDASAYETFIRQWNGTVKLYQDMLDRKSGTSSSSSGSNSGSSSAGGTTSGGTSSGGSSSGSSESTGGTTEGGSTSGSGTGTGSGTGSESGSGTGSGGDNTGGDGGDDNGEGGGGTGNSGDIIL